MSTVSIKIKDPAGQLRNFTVTGELTSSGKKARTVILIPPTGGLTFLDNYLTYYLNKKGFNILALTGFDGAWEKTPDWRVHDRGLKRGAAACRSLLSWARKSLESESFALIGSSMGALFAAMAVPFEKDVDRLVLIAGGSPVREIIADSIHPALLTIKAWREKNFDIEDDAHYREKLKEVLDQDICDVLKPHKSRKDLVIVAKRDLIIPSDYQYELVKLLKNPQVIEVNGGHISTIAYAETFLAKNIYQHIQ